MFLKNQQIQREFSPCLYNISV